MDFLSELEFRQNWFLLAILLALPAYALAHRASGRLIFSSFRLLPRRASSWRTRFAWLPSVLVAAAVASTGFALAGPRRDKHDRRVEREGIALMMVVDVSGSMRALDLSEPDHEMTRLDAVKEVFEDFVNPGGSLPGRPDDAIGLVSFALYADPRCPLTLDHDNLTHIAQGLQIVANQKENFTSIGDGLALAVEHLGESKAKSKVAILLTDGVNNAGEETPLSAAELAKTQGVKVYTVGAGTNGWAPVRAVDPFSGATVLRRMRVVIDEETLQEVAERTGGKYFRATDAEGLKRVYREIDKLERTKFQEDRLPEFKEYYAYFMALGLILACLGWVSRETLFRRLP